MNFGVCYYPEHWPESRWATDARMMREAGIEIVRIAEFAWTKMEPEEGVFEWDWLDRAIETLAAEELKVILGTPTATPPAWLTRTYPEILRVDSNGRSRDHGTRRHYCPTNQTYRRFCQKIVTELVTRYANHPDIIGWQTDNEIGGGHTARCYCDDCAAGFQTWLKAKYGSLAALNEAWGNIFWSQSYSAWEQIRTPSDHIDKKNPSHVLDYYRFASDTFVDFQKEQIDILRDHAPDHFVTHNFMGLYQDLDQYDLAADLDFATWDNYPTGNPERWRQLMYPPGMNTDSNDPVYAFDVGDPIITGMAHALTRALKDKPFWIMEQQCGQINWGKVNQWIRPGTTRLWSWHALMEGADTIVYFRWRPTIFAQEQYHSGILKHDGTADVGYFEHLKLAQEKALLDELTDQPFLADAAILFDFNDLWALQLQPHRKDYHYLRHLYVYYHALNRMGIPVNLVSPKADLSGYKLVIAPTAHLAGEETAVSLTTYVQNGGTLLLGVRSGFKTPTNLVTTKPLPGELRDLIGADVTSWRSLPEAFEMPFHTDIPNLKSPATYWADTLKPGSATPLATFLDGSGAALTEHAVGNGRCLYLGFYPTPAQSKALLAHLTNQLGIKSIATLPHGMLAFKRGPYIVLLNFTDEILEAVVGETAVTVSPRNVFIQLHPPITAHSAHPPPPSPAAPSAN